MGFPGDSDGKQLAWPKMEETQVRSLGWEDPLKKGMATHSSIQYPWGHKELDTTEQLNIHRCL